VEATETTGTVNVIAILDGKAKNAASDTMNVRSQTVPDEVVVSRANVNV
jgi:hypothetical protein